jgi:hypothetical protein
MVTTGTTGNTCSVLCEQIGATELVVRRRCDLFSATGEAVRRVDDSRVEELYNRLLVRCLHEHFAPFRCVPPPPPPSHHHHCRR